MHTMQMSPQPKANKRDAENGSYGLYCVIEAFRSQSPDPSRSPKAKHYA